MLLRPYQSTAISNAIAAIDRNPILVAPTGSGKTVMGVEIVKRLRVPTLWMAHRKELIDQAAEKLRTFGLSPSVMRSGDAAKKRSLWQQDAAEYGTITVSSVSLLGRRKAENLPPARLIVIDEAHHAAAESYQRIVAGLRGKPDLLGLTATPFRLDGRGLGHLFGELVVAATTRDLCRQGWLHEPRVYAGESPDLRGLRAQWGDYSLSEMSERANTVELLGDIVETWKKRAAGMRTVAFAIDVAHSQAICAAFREAGIAAEHLDGSTPQDDREAMLARLASGETQVVTNCMILTEGVDIPALECAILARPTASLNLHLQMIGRIMRKCDGKDGALVLDHAGNHHTHGMVTRRLKMTLDESERVGHSEPLGLRRCSACGLFFALRDDRCPECGWSPPVRQRSVEHTGGELQRFDDGDFEYRRQVWQAIEQERIGMDYKPGWSFFRYEERFGDRPIVDADDDLVDVANATMDQKKSVYFRLLATARERGFKDGWASHQYREAFGCWPRGFVQELRDHDARRRIRERWGIEEPEEEKKARMEQIEVELDEADIPF